MRPNAVGLPVLDADALNTGSDTAGFLDEVTLAYSRITWEYQPTGTSGKPVGTAVTGGWVSGRTRESDGTRQRG